MIAFSRFSHVKNSVMDSISSVSGLIRALTHQIPPGFRKEYFWILFNKSISPLRKHKCVCFDWQFYLKNIIYTFLFIHMSLWIGQCISVLCSPIISGCINNKISEPLKTVGYGNKNILWLLTQTWRTVTRVLVYSNIWINE